MDLLALKSLPLGSFSVVQAVSGLLAPSNTARYGQRSAANVIGENILSIGDSSVSTAGLKQIFSSKLFVSANPISDFKTLAQELFLNFGSNQRSLPLAQLYETSIPLSAAVEKFNWQSTAIDSFDKDSFVSFSNLPSKMIEGISNSFSSNSISHNFFQTSLPISSLRELLPTQKQKPSAKASTPTRLPYESGKRKSEQGLVSLFQKYLRAPK